MISTPSRLRTVAALALASSLTLAAAASAQSSRGGSREPVSLDDLFARVAARAPAFGGLFVDEATGSIQVYSWNRTPSGVAAAESALRAVFADQLPEGRVQVIPGQYGFRELKGWHDRLTGVLALPGVVSTDIDDRTNRLRVGVERAEVGWRVRDRLGALGIPGEAVDVVETAPVHLETGMRSKTRPVVGGVQVAFTSGGSTFLCTLGFNAVRGGVAGFVINSHCSGVQGGVQGTVLYQPTTLLTSYRVGVETVDPNYFTGSPCPAGRICRRSDSAFVKRDAGVTASQGRIARPPLNSLIWNGVDTYRIVKEADPLVGQTMTKVGRTTGRTQGQVSQVCVTVNVSGTNITQICQAFAGYNSAGGDSGSPVFRVVNAPSANDAYLAGIHWGSGGVFSTIGQIQRATAPAELGAVTTCAAGFTC